MARLRIVPLPGDSAEYLILFDRLTLEEEDSGNWSGENRPDRCAGIVVVPGEVEVA